MSRSKCRVLNIEIDNISFEELLHKFNDGLLVTPNVDHLIKLQKDRDFYQCYQQAAYTVCDSRILYLLSRVLFPSNPIRAQITGSDFFPAFCEYHAKTQNGAKVFLLGGTAESVLHAKDRINQKTNSQIVIGAYSPPFGFEKSAQETAKIIHLIRSSGADTLAIGVGAPKQEKWVCAHRGLMPEVSRYLAIGATIEFESGNLQRAPKWMTRFGLEWLFRLSQEPKRLGKRYLFEDMPIFFLLVKQRLGLYKNPWAASPDKIAAETSE
jgi:N-acetylglucosaminyldiphosphoundecaprenol N-acetyl-beta-D-mannosaminyltransferase